MKDDIVIGEIQLDGFQIVGGQYFSKPILPTLSVRFKSFQFNMRAYEELSACESVQFWVNLNAKRIAIEPVSSRDPNAVPWLRGYESKSPSRITCSMLTTQIFEKWRWNQQWCYRTNGRLVKSDRKIMLLFDFTNPDVFEGARMVRSNGRQ